MNFLIGLLVFFLALLGFCVWRIRAQGLSLATAKRWLLNILMALLMIGFFGACFFYAMSAGIGDELFIKWMNIILTAGVVFGYAVKEFWRFRKRWAFWVELGVLLVAHFIVLQRLHWQTASYFWLMIVVGIPEIFAVFVLMGLKFGPSAGPPSEDFPK
jgi:hypothetical protein